MESFKLQKIWKQQTWEVFPIIAFNSRKQFAGVFEPKPNETFSKG